MPNSLALGGYCAAAQIDTDDRCFSFIQPKELPRVSRPPVAQQLYDALELGLDITNCGIYINTITPDNILSVWIAFNYHNKLARVWLDQFLNQITAIMCYGSSYGATHADYIEELFFNQALAPYNEALEAELINNEKALQMLNACLENISTLSMGEMGTWVGATPYSRDFQITHRGSSWVMVESKRLDFRPIYDLGECRIVLYSKESDGSYTYQIDKKSEYVSGFPIGPETEQGTILFKLNSLEPGWGGGDTVGGAPRNSDGSRSLLPPEVVFDVVESVVKGKVYDRSPSIIL